MVYTEIKEKNKRKYYYRVLSVRNGKKFAKKRKYLGIGLSKKELAKKEKEADKELNKEKNKKIEQELKKIKAKIIPILKKHKVKRAGIFGSFVRGEQKKNSDLDILIKFNGSLLDLVGLEMKLKKRLQRKVDLLTYGGVHPLLKKRILDEEVKII